VVWIFRVASVWRGWVEGDAQADLDVPAGDADLFDEQSQELLLLRGVELVDDAADPFGEVVHAAAQLVASGQCGALFGEAGSLGLQVAVTVGDLGGAALQFGKLDQPGLVEVDQAAAFGVGGVDLAVQTGEFGAEQLVIGDGCGDRDRMLTGQE